MLSRKERDADGHPMPEKWLQSVTELLEKTYAPQCKHSSKTFHIYGVTYSDEVVIAASFVNEKDLAELPITYVISADLTKEQPSDKLLDLLVDSIGVFFDSYFSDTNWNNYITTWQETELKGTKVYYVITRENFAITIMANNLLK